MRRQRRHDLVSGDPGWQPLDEEHGNEFLQALRDAVRQGTQQRGRLAFLSSREAPASPIVAGDRAALVTVTASGTRITDRRRVR